MPQMFEYGFQHHESAAGFVAFAKHYMPFLHNLNPGCQTAAPEGEIADRATVVGAFDLIHALELCARMPTGCVGAACKKGMPDIEGLGTCAGRCRRCLWSTSRRRRSSG